ncbi:MAG: hypothetical protein JRI80_00130 [Deltaproteobacteria bacterium]|nr:hypothetical protein [Deltaproteobacteria bacterium]
MSNDLEIIHFDDLTDEQRNEFAGHIPDVALLKKKVLFGIGKIGIPVVEVEIPNMAAATFRKEMGLNRIQGMEWLAIHQNDEATAAFLWAIITAKYPDKDTRPFKSQQSVLQAMTPGQCKTNYATACRIAYFPTEDMPEEGRDFFLIFALGGGLSPLVETVQMLKSMPALFYQLSQNSQNIDKIAERVGVKIDTPGDEPSGQPTKTSSPSSSGPTQPTEASE